MENKKQTVESNEEFNVIFGGKSSVDAELFSKSLDSIKFLVKEGGKVAGITSGKKVKGVDNSLRLEIKATKEGSFDILFDLILTHMPTITSTVGEGISFLSDVFTIVGGWILIKKHLKGSREKNIKDLGDNKSEIENKDGEKKIFHTNIVNYFFNNPKVDKSIVKLFSENDREYMLLKSKKISVRIPKSEFVDMTNVVSVDNEEIIQRKTTEVIAELYIRKPDLLRKSMWGFLRNDLPIDATIKDDLFLKKIRNGMKLNAGLKIRCNLQIEEKIGKKGKFEVVEYNVLEVMGDPFQGELF